MMMTHPGLPDFWALIVLGFMGITVIFALAKSAPANTTHLNFSLVSIPVLGRIVEQIIASRWVLLLLKIMVLGFFLTIIIAGLLGTPVPERNLATVLTWNLWWSGLIFSIFFLGSAWCAVCPWDTLAQWLVRRRLWLRADNHVSLNLKVPKWLANVWPALFLFVALTWLELGVDITSSPYATAVVSLLMVVLATASLAIFKRKAFCRYFCPIGRTIGFYSQLSAIELRPIKQSTCQQCKTLDCYYGTKTIEACPTWLVMGRLKQNSYCTSCGNCTQSCPQQNIAWRFRKPSVEALHSGRVHWDESWFMIGLLALTGFHGLTMMPFWAQWMSQLAQIIGDSGHLLWSFSIGLIACLFIISFIYSVFIGLTGKIMANKIPFKRLFSNFAFVALPLAFCYHMAHNLNHLIREGGGFTNLLSNPLGINTVPLSMMEKHERHMSMWLSQDVLFAIQAGLIMVGFWVAIQVIRYRSLAFVTDNKKHQMINFMPIIFFVIIINGFHLWLLMQPMTMRM